MRGFYHFLRTQWQHIISFPVRAFSFAQFHPITCSYTPQSSETTQDPPVVWARFYITPTLTKYCWYKNDLSLFVFLTCFIFCCPILRQPQEALTRGPSLIQSANREPGAEQGSCGLLGVTSSPGPSSLSCPKTSNGPGLLEVQIRGKPSIPLNWGHSAGETLSKPR